MRKEITDILQVGKCYFHLGYYDKNLAFPFIETYFFLGKNLFPDVGFDAWFFQEAPHFLGSNTPMSLDACEQNGVIHVPSHGLQDFMDWQGLIDELVENKVLQDQGKFLSQRT